MLNRTQMVAGECHFSPKSPYLGGGLYDMIWPTYSSKRLEFQVGAVYLD